MTTDELKAIQPLDRLIWWIQERESIRKKKVAGKPKPWSDNQIMQLTYFTNVRREDDKVTTWLRENVREPLADDPKVLFAVIAFRWFNWIPTGRVLIDDFGGYRDLLQHWDLKKAIARLEEMKQTEQVFTGAFNISNSGSTKPKVNRVCEDYIQPVWERRETLTSLGPFKSCEIAFNLIRGLPGLGGSGFMAGQVVCDLAYTYLLRDAPDWWTWSTAGPGSRKGMNIILGKDEDATVPKDWHDQINHLRVVIKQRTKLNLHARDVQNCLCEFSKLCRILQGGSSKRKYPGV